MALDGPLLIVTSHDVAMAKLYYAVPLYCIILHMGVYT